MTTRWTAARFLARARELTRRLEEWHVEGYLRCLHFASRAEAEQAVRKTFGELLPDVTTTPRPQPGGGLPLGDDEDGEEEEVRLDVGGDRRPGDTAGALTLWLLADFLRHLGAADALPALDALRASFVQLLGRRAWAVREPRTVPEKSMADFAAAEKGTPRPYIVTGRPVPPEALDGFLHAADALHAAAPPDWGADVDPATGKQGPDNSEKAGAQPADQGGELTALAPYDPAVPLAWLRRVSPEWPPMGVDWALVLKSAEKLWCGGYAGDARGGLPRPTSAESVSYCVRRLTGEEMRRADPRNRACFLGLVLLDAMGQLKAYCRATVFMEPDPEAIAHPADRDLPFDRLACLGVPTVALIRGVRAFGLKDMLVVPVVGSQLLQFGWVYGTDMFRALWCLAGKIWESFEYHIGGRFDLRDLDLQSVPELRRVWWRFAKAMADQLPGSMEVEGARIQLLREWRAADAARCDPKAPREQKNEGDGADQLDAKGTTEEQPECDGANQPARKGKKIDERMLKKLHEDRDGVIGWSVREWAQYLDCSVSTVQGTTAWRTILTTRTMKEVEDASRRKHHQPPDRRHFPKKKRSESE